MIAVLGAAAGDVLWSCAFLARHALPILALSAIPAVQRVVAAFHNGPARPVLYAVVYGLTRPAFLPA